jgi:hypothetical protein
MNRDHARPEYMLFDAGSEAEMDRLADRAVFLERRAMDIHRADSAFTAPDGKDRVDSLVERFRLHQES